MKKQLLIFGALILMGTTLSAQTVLWQEDFESYAEGTGIIGDNDVPIGDYPAGVTKWTLDLSGAPIENSTSDYFKVNSQLFKARDTDGEAIITFQSVDISSETGDVTIKIGVLNFALFTATPWFNPGYVDVEYSLDGGSAFTKVPNYMSEGNADHTFYRPDGGAVDYNISGIAIVIPDATIGAATSIIMRYKMRTDGSNNEIRVDDVEITRNAVSLFSEDFDSYTPSTGLVGAGSELSEEVGDYASVTKWSLTLANSMQLVNNVDQAKTKSINSNLVLHFDDVNDDVTFETETIDITGKSQITFGMDVMFANPTGSNGGYEADDYFDVYYSTDNGATYTLAQDNGAGHTFSGTNNITNETTVNFSETLNGLSATQLKLKFVVNSDFSNEDFDVDNIKVVEGSSLSVASNELVGLKMYPNPVKDNIINITSSIKNLPISINIYDITGKSLFNTKTTNTAVSLPNLPEGVYIAKFTQDGKSAVKKLIIQ